MAFALVMQIPTANVYGVLSVVAAPKLRLEICLVPAPVAEFLVTEARFEEPAVTLRYFAG